MKTWSVPNYAALITLATHRELATRLDELERRVEQKLSSHDQAIAGLIHTIRELMKPPEPHKRSIGFVSGEGKPKKDG